MYKYKAPHDGITRFSVKGLKHIDKIGKLVSIEAYTVGSIMNGAGDSKWVDNKIRIIVRGETGTCTYGGFLWGYGGEGPHGLRDLFLKCGMNRALADHYAFTSVLGDNSMPLYGTKLYNATTVWKFMNSIIGWNRVK